MGYPKGTYTPKHRDLLTDLSILRNRTVRADDRAVLDAAIDELRALDALPSEQESTD